MTVALAPNAPETRLEAGCADLGLELDASKRETLLAYLRLLEKWNGSFNLTAVRSLQDMVTLHLLDSLAILPFVVGENCLDVGTGAGLPGLVLAIAEPGRAWVLLDSNGKKTRFLTEACRVLGVNNVSVMQSRAEDHVPEIKYDVITSRAVASLWSLACRTRHLLLPDGRHLAMKGTLPVTEIDECLANDLMTETIPLTVPGLDAERFLVRMSSKQHYQK